LKDITIALDAMGGDHGIGVTVPAALDALVAHPNLKLILVGDEPAISVFLSKSPYVKTKCAVADRLSIRHTSQTIAMDESPSLALRGKKDSSMRVSINLVKEGVVHAAVSAGNTGALMATAHFVLKTITGVDRAAILGYMPADNAPGYVRMLDLGANVDSTPEQLVQFAVMGSVVAKAVGHIENPRVALLNIGSEEIKGNEQVKQAAELLSQHSMINYIGFAEGDDVFKDIADVIICDGFTGNIALKTTEGTAKLIAKIIKEEFKRNVWTKILAVIAMPILKALIKRLDPARYNGASFLGLKGIVVKSHGGANIKGLVSAIERAMNEVKSNVIHLIEERVAHLLEQKNV
jgi:glycerol-3-phosphate acyltransferase PlsX